MSQICPKCQSTNIDTAKFCKKCGNALQPSAVGGQTLSAIEQRALEEKLYEQVAIELKNGQRKEGLYTKALVDANGSEELANVLYIKYAVQSLQDVLTLQAEQERAIWNEQNKENIRQANQLKEAQLSEQRKLIKPTVTSDSEAEGLNPAIIILLIALFCVVIYAFSII